MIVKHKITAHVSYIYMVSIFCFFLSGCASHFHLVKTDSNNYKTEAGEQEATDIKNMIAPYKEQLDAEMEKVIGQLGMDMVKEKPESTLGNFVADLVHEQCEKYYQKSIDFTVVNYGGLRIPSMKAGPITRGKVFELMPFDNMMVIMELDGESMQQLFGVMAEKGGWPISKQVQYQIKEGKPEEIKINGLAFDPNKTYKVALSDYLANGGDGLFFLREKKQFQLGKLFRDAILEYIESQKNQFLSSSKDGRVRIF